MSKRILFLGASKFQLPPIKYARDKGYIVYTCDNLPDNPGHNLADKSFNVSTTDIEGVLQLSRMLKIDGIVAYASDPSAPTQAYVANHLDLVGNPFESVLTLTRKDLFREFLKVNGFHVPRSSSFDNSVAAREWLQHLGFPAIVKPVDSSGSKGVTKINSMLEFENAYDLALKFSRLRKVVIEKFFERAGYQVAGDGFAVNGKLAFHCWANEHFNHQCNPLVPIGESFPAVLPNTVAFDAYSETQRLFDLLGITVGAFNFDFHYDKSEQFSFLELGPRNGGNLIPEVIKYCTDIDLVSYTVESALGRDCSALKQVEPSGCYSSYIIHSMKDGCFKGVTFHGDIESHIVEKNIYLKKGDPVYRFDGSHCSIGSLILKFDNIDEMLSIMDKIWECVRVQC